MKPARFAYTAPRSLEDALSQLDGDQGAAVLAGGQSLVPMLNFRLATPGLLVDLNPLTELDYLESSDGALRIGALTRQATLERSELVEREWPLLGQAVRTVAHPAIRSRGTVGGSVAHADPRAELPVALTALDARFHLRSSRGERSISASDFFRGPLITSREDHELLTEIEVPPMPTGARTAFVERANTHGNFAIAGAAVVLAPGERAAIALLGARPVPVRAVGAERALVAGAGAAEVGELTGAEVVDEYRRALITALVRQAIEMVQS
jgi:CO/xanthine dehydrogenase FAD-binding subunit